MTENDESPIGVVVVGVDGSAGANAALRWAVAEARLRKTQVRAVHAWTVGYTGVVGGGYGYLGGTLDNIPGLTLSDRHAAAETLLKRATTELAADAAAEGVKIERKVVEGGAAEVLVGAVAEGDLLVVGSRGHGGFAGLLLGSVSQQCAHHAPCPVVIVQPLNDH
ncbi:MAG: universal stress protein [Solirubrobacteraceae bacterium]